MGNEAADLDSVVSALVHSRVLSQVSKQVNIEILSNSDAHLFQIQSSAQRVFVPIINIPRVDLPLRTEVRKARSCLLILQL